MDAQTPVPFGLDPTTFALLVATGVLLVNRLIEALIPKGSRFKFIRRWLEVPEDDDDPRDRADR